METQGNKTQPQMKRRHTRLNWLNPLFWLVSFVRCVMAWQQRRLERNNHADGARPETSSNVAESCATDSMDRNMPHFGLFLFGVSIGEVSHCDIQNVSWWTDRK